MKDEGVKGSRRVAGGLPYINEGTFSLLLLTSFSGTLIKQLRRLTDVYKITKNVKFN